MPKSTAQLENEREVRKVMVERGYGFLSEKELEEAKKSEKNKKRTVLIIIFIILLLVAISPFVVNEIINIQLAHANTGLKACLEKIEMSPNTSENPSIEEIRDVAKARMEEYTKKMECHNSNKTADFDSVTNELSEKIEMENLTMCLSDAEINYATSKEEIANAEKDTQSILVILKRWDSKYATQLECYGKYKGSNDFQSEKSAIQAVKSENQSYIEMAKNEIRNQNNSSYYRNSRSLYCSTNSIGSYSWSNCY